MKKNLNDLLIALGAIGEPIDDEVQLEKVSAGIADYYSGQQKVDKDVTDSKTCWYVVFLEMSKGGTAIGSIVIDIHPLIWSKENSGKKIIQAGKNSYGDLQVINFIPISQEVFDSLSK